MHITPNLLLESLIVGISTALYICSVVVTTKMLFGTCKFLNFIRLEFVERMQTVGGFVGFIFRNRGVLTGKPTESEEDVVRPVTSPTKDVIYGVDDIQGSIRGPRPSKWSSGDDDISGEADSGSSPEKV